MKKKLLSGLVSILCMISAGAQLNGNNPMLHSYSSTLQNQWNGPGTGINGLPTGAPNWNAQTIDFGLDDITPCDVLYDVGASDGLGDLTLLGLAADFPVAADVVFEIERLNLILMNPVVQVNVAFYGNNAGLPGAEIMSPTAITPDAMTEIATGIYLVELTLPTPISLEGGESGNLYWLGISSIANNASYWIYTEGVQNGTNFAGLLGGEWVDVGLYGFPYDGAFLLEGNCITPEEPIEGCFNSPNGQYPTGSGFTPACNGLSENITTAGWTGEYSLVHVTAGTEYIFSSSISSDFITIADSAGTIAYTSGVGSVTYTATANETIRFYLHLDSDCNVASSGLRARRVQCGEIVPPPANDDCANAIAVACGDSVSGSTATATNSGGNAAGDVFYKFTGNGEAQIVTLSLCDSSFDTYLRVYSDCTLATQIAFNDDSCGTRSELTFESDGTSTYYIMVEGFSSSTGNYVLDVTCEEPYVFDDPDYDCYQGDGEISALENGYGILESDVYRVADDFTVDAGTEFTLRQVTMSFLSTSGVSSATIRIHEDAAGFPGTEIENMTLTPTTNVEYGEAFGFTAHRVEFALATPITLGEGTYWLNVTTPNATYWVTTTSGTSGSVVALSNNSGAAWVLDDENFRSVFYVEGDCNDVATEEPCLDTPNGSWGSLTPACSGAPELVTSAAWTGEYSSITVTAGTEYIFSSSVNTDFITIASPDGSVAYAAGVTPITWTATTSETVRFILHNNSDCEFENVSRSKFVQCGEILPPPANDDCEDAIAVACGDTVTGATTFATNSGGNSAGDVFYKFTGTGSAQMVTLSLCNSTYDTAIRVFTDCGLGTEVAYNDDSCGVQSEVTFMSDGTSTYYIMVEGWSSSTGNYELNVTCFDPPVYDPCAPVHEGVATNGVGFVNNGSDNYMAANDFNVLANTQFEVEKFTINVVTLGGAPTTFDMMFFEGDTAVGAQFGETLTSITPSSITENGTFGSTGYPVYSVEITLPNTVIFPATATADKKYWVGISGAPTGSGNPVFWVSSDYVYTDTLPTYQSANGGATFDLFVSSTGATVEGDMIIDGECATLGLSDISGAKFAYYPNPVNDVLNITTSKGIEKVEVFNLAGQSVMTNGKVTNGQVNVSALTSGLYVFRVTLEGGQVETFKVIKK
ncbi:T9SS type A sorting domain-containing protein [Moheibacter stercoris]|uniref:Secretion system C-terminal sorting domain-containing protein n=1 Tax=Moheibacter stercoris TaxID=1628251 RepID=A0ABV2LZ87_9FLAO